MNEKNQTLFAADRKHPDHGSRYLFFQIYKHFTFGGITGLAVLVADKTTFPPVTFLSL